MALLRIARKVLPAISRVLYVKILFLVLGNASSVRRSLVEIDEDGKQLFVKPISEKEAIKLGWRKRNRRK
jgi:hypothetical protein